MRTRNVQQSADSGRDFCCCWPLAPIRAAAELRPFIACYAVTWHGMSAGRASWNWSACLGDRWILLLRAARPQRPVPLAHAGRADLRAASSRSARQVLPEHFTGDDGSDATDRDQDLRFDWERGRVTGTPKAAGGPAAPSPALQDDMSVQIALMHALLAGRTPARFADVRQERRSRNTCYTEQGSETAADGTGRRATR